MTPRHSASVLSATLAVALALVATEAQAQCNWEFAALADIWELPLGDEMTSYHFTEIENVDCVNSRKIALKATVLHNNAIRHNKNYLGDAAVQGQFLIKNLSFSCGLSSWRATTKGGTHLAVYVWYATDNSPIFYPGCECPDDGGGGGGYSPTEIAVVGGGSRVVESSRLEVPMLALPRLSNLDGMSYFVDQWAVLDDRTVRSASSREFGELAENRARAVGAGSDVRVLVEAPIHPHNERWIARPTVELGEGLSSRKLPRSLESFARIDFLPGGNVLEAELLYTSRNLEPLDRALLVAELEERTRLVFGSRGRHRAAAFVELETGVAGELTLVDGIVVLHRCRCGPE